MSNITIVHAMDESSSIQNFIFRSFADILSTVKLDKNELFGKYKIYYVIIYALINDCFFSIKDIISEVVGKDNAKCQKSCERTSKLIDIVHEDLEYVLPIIFFFFTLNDNLICEYY